MTWHVSVGLKINYCQFVTILAEADLLVGYSILQHNMTEERIM